jgi:drug/metabolite transporter (DMT)-like permease
LNASSRLFALAAAGLVLANLFWAGNAVVARGVADQIPPMALNFWRWLLALVFILPFGLPKIRRDWSTIRRSLPQLFALSIVSIVSYNALLYSAAQTTTAINITLVSATITLSVALFGWALLRLHTSPVQWLGIALGIAGIAVTVTRGELAVLLELEFNRGDLLVLTAVACWGLYSVLLRRFALPIHPVAMLTMLIALGMPLIATLYGWELLSHGGFEMRAGLVPPIVFVAIFPALLAYLFWVYGVQIAGPTLSSMSIYLMPVFASLLAVAFLGERLRGYHFAGGLLILAGLYLATRNGRKAS